MPTITVEMVQELNRRLAAKGAPLRIVEREYPDALYDKNLIAQPGNNDVAPLLIDEITYTNCGTSKQSVRASVDKKLVDQTKITISQGIKLGWKATFEIDVVAAKVKNEVEVAYDFRATGEQTWGEEITYKFEVPIEVPPMKRVVFQAVVQQEKIKDVPFTLLVFLKGGQVAVVPQGLARMRRYFNDADHFYTITEDHPEDVGYREEGSPGYIFREPVSGTVPLLRYYNGTDHFYTIDPAELGEGRDGYVREGIAGHVYPSPQPGSLPLLRYYNGTEHFYTTDADELGQSRFGYVLEGNAGHMIPAAIAEGGTPQDITVLFPETSERTFELHGTFRGESTVRQANIVMVESEATAAECSILARKLGGVTEAPRSRDDHRGLYAERTAAAALVGRAPHSAPGTHHPRFIVPHARATQPQKPGKARLPRHGGR